MLSVTQGKSEYFDMTPLLKKLVMIFNMKNI